MLSGCSHNDFPPFWSLTSISATLRITTHHWTRLLCGIFCKKKKAIASKGIPKIPLGGVVGPLFYDAIPYLPPRMVARYKITGYLLTSSKLLVFFLISPNPPQTKQTVMKLSLLTIFPLPLQPWQEFMPYLLGLNTLLTNFFLNIKVFPCPPRTQRPSVYDGLPKP
jgi:hypothetical protein